MGEVNRYEVDWTDLVTPSLEAEKQIDSGDRWKTVVLASDYDALEAAKDGAYRERDQLVAALTKVFPAHLARHPDDDTDWDDDWRWIVFVDLPTGQASWHIHDSEFPLFSHLSEGPNTWDGHSTAEKYRRLARMGANNDL